MNILEEIEKILNQHDCHCYKIDKENNKIIYEGVDSCCTLHPSVAQITGFLLLNNISYEMKKNKNIELNIPSLVSQ